MGAHAGPQAAVACRLGQPDLELLLASLDRSLPEKLTSPFLWVCCSMLAPDRRLPGRPLSTVGSSGKVCLLGAPSPALAHEASLCSIENFEKRAEFTKRRYSHTQTYPWKVTEMSTLEYVQFLIEMPPLEYVRFLIEMPTLEYV